MDTKGMEGKEKEGKEEGGKGKSGGKRDKMPYRDCLLSLPAPCTTAFCCHLTVWHGTFRGILTL